jgi:transcriptional regulator with XRE-family HTH domain
MFHERLRDARHARGLTQQRLAKLADVPRSQLQKLERGDNVTLATIQKTIGQLTGLRLDVVPESLDVGEIQRNALDVRRILVELLAAVERLIYATGASAGATGASTGPLPPSDAVATQGPLPGAGGATRHESGIDPQLLDRLEKELTEAQNAPPEGKH